MYVFIKEISSMTILYETYAILMNKFIFINKIVFFLNMELKCSLLFYIEKHNL